jgi:hypothetical protein
MFYSNYYYAVTYFDWNDPQRYKWLGRGGYCHKGFDEIVKASLSFVAALARGEPVKAVLYEIGKALQGHVDVTAKTLFGKTLRGKKLESVAGALDFFSRTNERARASVETFMLVSRRKKLLCRDTLGIIAKMVWAARLDELKEEDHGSSSRARQLSKRRR